MALPYNVWTDEQIANRNSVEKGNYPFKIKNCVLKDTKVKLDNHGQPKPTNKMLEIDFEFYDANGVVRRQRDWIVFTENMDWKLRHLADSVDLLYLYEAGSLTENHLNDKEGVFELGLQDYTDQNGVTKKSNFVVDYVKKSAQVAVKEDSFLDDDLTL